MSDFTTYSEEQIVDWLVGGVDVAPAPANIYVALHTSDPGESPDGTTEVDSGTYTYSRVSTIAGTDWNQPSVDKFENSVEIEFPEASNTWGTISHFSLWDGSADSDNALAKSALDSARTVESGDAPVFRVGNLSGEVL